VKPKNNRIIALVLFVTLVALSFLKDNLTPDYLNTPAASFLNPNQQMSRLATWSSHPLFWSMACLYSLLFTLLPYWIIAFYTGNKKLSQFVLFLHFAVYISIYVLIMANMNIFDRAIVPKLNRYYHSPVMVLFFIAAFTLSQRKHVKD
jgi:hypothetical protein